ncbi:DNA polymerase epsilon subunit 4 [Atheta coriaria]|uniref:DNA polymerase epsilon subunit 4 n=1 Tax=Dalotia coriaria TaxID=877792 RepID=UPI0031F46C96
MTNLEDNNENLEQLGTEEAGPSSENKENKTPEKVRLVKLPLATVKRIMKADPDVHLITQDAVFLTTKATEFFIEMLGKATFECTLQAKKKTLMKQDFEKVMKTASNLCFLDGMMD